MSSSLGNTILDLVYPKICLHCSAKIYSSDHLCPKCRDRLIMTDFHLINNNELKDRFFGKCDLEHALAMYRLDEKSVIETIIHHIKYHDRKDLAVSLGKTYGLLIADILQESNVNAIIPVPLHWIKKRKRGYNQANAFAEGLSISAGIPLYSNGLIRTRNTASQTTLGHLERMKNMKNAFSINHKEIHGKNFEHILLVDDVITTGSTITSCMSVWDKSTRFSLASIAMAI